MSTDHPPEPPKGPPDDLEAADPAYVINVDNDDDDDLDYESTPAQPLHRLPPADDLPAPPSPNPEAPVEPQLSRRAETLRNIRASRRKTADPMWSPSISSALSPRENSPAHASKKKRRTLASRASTPLQEGMSTTDAIHSTLNTIAETAEKFEIDTQKLLQSLWTQTTQLTIPILYSRNGLVAVRKSLDYQITSKLTVTPRISPPAR